MSDSQTKVTFLPKNKDTALLPPIIFILLLFLGGAILLLCLDDDFIKVFKQFYLLPWILLVAAVVAAPGIYLLYTQQFSLFHPLVFPAWSYFLPAFVFGGLILATGISQPYFLVYVEDERYNLPLTMVYVALGYGGLITGFCLSPGRKVGEKMRLLLPVWKWESRQITLPAFVLLCIGLANLITGFVYGILGYQKRETIGAYDGLLFVFSLFWIEASFLLWLSIFRAHKLNLKHYLSIAVLLVISLTNSAFQGNRGSLLGICILIGFAFVLSGRQVNIRQGAIGGVILTLAILAGMIYGTTFRVVKENESKIGIETYFEYILNTFDRVAEQDLFETVEVGLIALAERLESVSSLAVTVANYEKLQPYEESYGLDNNIRNDLTTFLIPRFIWQDKPIISDPRKYGDLYFNYSENSFTITPIGDLLRNFGPVGVPLGMMFLGLVVRLFYAALIEKQDFSFWRVTLFYMLLTSISYEGFYSTIFPYMVKVGIVSVIGILVIRFFIKDNRQPRA